jgi:hypothetical protein
VVFDVKVDFGQLADQKSAAHSMRQTSSVTGPIVRQIAKAAGIVDIMVHTQPVMRIVGQMGF